MSESELAFNANGEPFAVPETATGWRVRRLRGGRGAPELVYGRDGRPLTLGIEAGMDELRDAVEVSGRYRLDAIDDEGKVVEHVPPSYVQVTVAERNAAPVEPAPPIVLTSVDHALREVVRANVELVRTTSELAKTVATQHPDLVKAAAEILRAADGAGLPRREPMADWADDDDDEAEDTEEAPKPAFDFNVLMSHLSPVIARLTGIDPTKMAILAGSPGPVASGAAPQAATPSASAAPARSTTTSSQPRRAIASDKEASTEDTSASKPAAAANPMAHLAAIQAQLTAEERTFVQGVIAQLSPADLIQWRDQLAHSTVDEAVAAIRTEIKKHKEANEEQVS